MDKSKIAQEVKSIIAEVLSIEASLITDDVDLMTSFNADSMDLASIVMLIEDEFSISIPETAIANLRTFKDIRDFIEKAAN